MSLKEPVSHKYFYFQYFRIHMLTKECPWTAVKHALPSKKIKTSTSRAGECLFRASLCSLAWLLGAAASDVGRRPTGQRNVWLCIPA